MELLDHTELTQPTLMRDLYVALIGKEVRVFTIGSHMAWGKLAAFNGHILQVVDEERITYIPVQNVSSISVEEIRQ